MFNFNERKAPVNPIIFIYNQNKQYENSNIKLLS